MKMARALVSQRTRVAHCETGDVVCDHYYRYRENVAIMKEVGLKSYHFSISWIQMLPDGTGHVKQKGVDYVVGIHAPF